MRVVKLGGSLLETGKMFDCLKHIVSQNKQTVVVCGGGLFANTVRAAQKKWHFDDIVAHEMAILAMQQTALMCQNLQPEFELFSKTQNFQNQRFAIWLPDLEQLNNAEIEPSWNITSDTLAAWLANELDVDELVVVKSCEIDTALALSELTDQEIIDAGFADFVLCTEFYLKILSVTEFLKT